jgi:hypothetical protein
MRTIIGLGVKLTPKVWKTLCSKAVSKKINFSWKDLGEES